MIPPRVVLATANPGKVAELRELLAEWGALEVTALDAFTDVVLPEESGATYAANAAAKAIAVAAATGLPALGDDSGLEVDALGGGPGIRSARYASSERERIAKLLAALRDVCQPARRARFVCAVALAWPEGPIDQAEGSCEGSIAERPAGTGGFGYDPVFLVAELGRTFAEATPQEKNRLSHRAAAVRALRRRLETRVT